MARVIYQRGEHKVKMGACAVWVCKGRDGAEVARLIQSGVLLVNESVWVEHK